MTIGTAGLKSLRIDCVVGIHEHERRRAQPIVVDIELDYEFADAVRSDEITLALDYDRVAADVTELAQRRKFRLIETMAETVAGMLLETHPALRAVRLEVRKPDAVANAECAFVRVERVRR